MRRTVQPLLIGTVLWMAAALCEGIQKPEGHASESALALRFENATEAGVARWRFRLDGLPSEVLENLEARALGSQAWSRFLAVFVEAEDRPPLIGRYRIEGPSVLFEPAFSLQPGLLYHAVFRPARLDTLLGRPTGLSGKDLIGEWRVPTVPRRRTEVLAIYPSSSRLPENLLKFYLHFSAPMSQGDVYRFLEIVDSQGVEVELAILELEHELWDPSGRRLTLLFDPGRLKSGLVPNREDGLPLERDHDFALVISRDWKDVHGQPLANDVRKTFSVIDPDYESPRPESWRIEVAEKASLQPLTVHFGEPLDQALLQHMIWITDETGSVVDGSIRVGLEERSWQFFPEQPWRGGRYSLLAHPRLEDLAGNSVAKLFEVEINPLDDRSLPSEEPAVVEFEIR